MIINCKICGKNLTMQALLLLDGEIKRIKCNCLSKNEHSEEDKYKNKVR